jgi:ketosteroid isomerase-like protein
MRTALLLCAVLVTACGDREVAARSTPDSATPVETLTDAQRQVTEDSVRAWMKYIADRFEHADSAALMGIYRPTGPVVSVQKGKLVTSRDSAAKSMSGLTQLTDLDASFGEPTIDVVAPGVAALAVHSNFAGKEKGRPFNNPGMLTVVLALQDGRMRVIQEHFTETPESKK